MKRISLLILSLLFLSTAFQLDKLMTSGWTLQILPNLNGAQISDVTFLDSLTGFYVTNDNVAYDTSYILKTTNGGNNWSIKNIHIGGFNRIVFVDSLIGYACGGTNSGTSHLYKTTDRGENWSLANAPSTAFWRDLSVINKDTMWLTDDDGLIGGIFRTTNGGISWTNLLYAFQHNPDKIYMVNKNLGFISRNRSYEGRTTNGGLNWTIQSAVDSAFGYMRFVDSLTGWKCFDNLKKTTDGGITWFSQYLPEVVGSNFNGTGVGRLSIINKDTVFSVGGWYDDPNNVSRCIIYKTTNGGLNWGYQIPDTSFNIWQLTQVDFTDKNNGWAFKLSGICIHTITGGSDTTFYTAINNNQNQIVTTDFVLEQNYPNPFNPVTTIKYQLLKSGNVKISVFDVTGKSISTLVNEYKHSGNYSVKFDGGNLSSGVYLYKLEAIDRNSSNVFIETKRMLLIK